MTLTLEKMRADVAAALDIPADDIATNEHLGDLGLDSIALMRLLMGWEELQPTLPSEKLYECDTLDEFWTIAKAAR